MIADSGRPKVGYFTITKRVDEELGGRTEPLLGANLVVDQVPIGLPVETDEGPIFPMFTTAMAVPSQETAAWRLTTEPLDHKGVRLLVADALRSLAPHDQRAVGLDIDPTIRMRIGRDQGWVGLAADVRAAGWRRTGGHLNGRTGGADLKKRFGRRLAGAKLRFGNTEAVPPFDARVISLEAARRLIEIEIGPGVRPVVELASGPCVRLLDRLLAGRPA